MDLFIAIILTSASLLFFLAFFLSTRACSKCPPSELESKTDIWLLISVTALLAGAESFLNALGWFGVETLISDTFEDYFTVAFLLLLLSVTLVLNSSLKQK